VEQDTQALKDDEKQSERINHKRKSVRKLFLETSRVVQEKSLRNCALLPKFPALIEEDDEQKKILRE
jgi:hypothetical protein